MLEKKSAVARRNGSAGLVPTGFIATIEPARKNDIARTLSVTKLKRSTLYFLPHAMIIASSLLAVQQVATLTMFLSGAAAKSATVLDQSPNRALKRDRLPILQEKVRGNIRPSPIQKFETDCKPPIDVRGRCFA